MDELSEEDKLTVSRARKMQKFLSQPFQVAEVFTGTEGKYVPLKETISGFKKVLGGQLFIHLEFPQALEIMENLENHKKSSMHGKIIEFEKKLNNHGKIMEFCGII